MHNITYKPSKKSMDKIKIACALAIATIWITLFINAKLTILTILIGITSSFLIPFGVIMLFNFPKNTQIDLTPSSIGFHVLSAKDSPFIFHFNEIDKIVIGSVKSAFRQNRNTYRKFFGIEFQISEKIDEYTVHYMYSFPLKHIDNYQDFINKVEEYAKVNNVPFEKQIF